MKISIHQPHYFPWIGYFDKMAKADVFVLLDEVQFEKQSQMSRNRIIDGNGQIKFLSIPVDLKNFLNKKYLEIECIDSKWKIKHLNILENYYRDSKYKIEIMNDLRKVFSNEDNKVCGWTCRSIEYVREILDIKTPIVYQSEIDYDRTEKKSELVLSICKKLNADVYFSGKGASVNYLNYEKFDQSDIKIEFQEFVHPLYPQLHTNQFVAGLSILDMLFNCGKEKTKEIFWANINK